MAKWFASNRQLVLRLIGSVLAIGLIYVLVREEGWGEVVSAIKQISWQRMAWGLLFVLISRLFVTARWYVLLRSGNVRISFWNSAALTFTGLFSNNFLPTTIGGDVVRLAGAMQLGYDRPTSLASLAADRLLGMLGMACALPFGLPQALSVLGGNGAQSMALPPLFKRMWSFARRTLQSFSTWLQQPWALLAGLGCTWGHMLFTFAALYTIIEGLGAHVDFPLLGGLWSVTYFVTLVPISIARSSNRC